MSVGTNAQSGTAGQSGTGGPAKVQETRGDRDIIVKGGGVRRRGEWKRAESDHIVMFSKGDDGELKRVTNNLEHLYYLMSRLYRQGGGADETLKIQVILVDSQKSLQAMQLSDLRSQEGPFSDIFSGRLYYDPREDGEMLVVARSDQTIDVNTSRSFNADCDDYQAAGGMELCGAVIRDHPPVVRSWEAVLYSGFAQHFILTHVPAAYPRWYLDGIGALFSTIAVGRDRKLDYAGPPPGYKNVFRSYGYPDVDAILSGRYLDAAQDDARWSPYDAWLLAHYFLFSKLKPERSRQFQDYMAAIRRGAPMAEAARIFGDMRRLQREIVTYAGARVAYARDAVSPAPDDDPSIITLSPAGAALIEARIEIDTRLAAPRGISSEADWLARVREKVAGLPFDADVLLVEAEAECRSGRHGECLATAEQILANAPDDARALAWKGVALTGQAINGPVADRTAMLAVARGTIERAIALDDQAPLPLIAHFQSFAKAGERVPEQVMLGMARVVRSVPAAPSPRLYLAEELVRQGDADTARRLLYPVVYGAYDSPEKRTAQRLFRGVGSETPAGH